MVRVLAPTPPGRYGAGSEALGEEGSMRIHVHPSLRALHPIDTWVKEHLLGLREPEHREPLPRV